MFGGLLGVRPWRSEMVVLRRKSWVMAIPMEAKAREVRSQARKVRSVQREGVKSLVSQRV